jgi:hypothetical protein
MNTCCFATDESTETCGLPAAHEWRRPRYNTRHYFCDRHWDEMAQWFETVEGFTDEDDELLEHDGCDDLVERGGAIIPPGEPK